MVKHTWKGPGVFGHKDGDVLPGKPMPEDVSTETLARLVEKGSVVKGDLPAAAAATDELVVLRQQLVAAITVVKDLRETNETLTGELAAADELLKSLTVREQEMVEQLAVAKSAGSVDVGALQEQIDTLTAANNELVEQLAAAQKNIAELTAMVTGAGAGPKGGKK